MNGHALFFFVRCGEGKEKFVNLPLDRACAEMGGKSARAHPFRHSSIRITPYTTLASVPNTMTGPATTNIFDAIPVMKPSGCVKIDIQFFRNFFSRLQSGGAYCFSLPLQMQTRSKYAYLSQSLLKGTHEPALQNF